MVAIIGRKKTAKNVMVRVLLRNNADCTPIDKCFTRGRVWSFHVISCLYSLRDMNMVMGWIFTRWVDGLTIG
jgi:hypothetical protein